MRFAANRIGLLLAGWLVVVAVAYGQTAGKEIKIEGVIADRNGVDMIIRTGTGNVVVTLNDGTTVEGKEGVLHLQSNKQEAVMALVPGLKVAIHGFGTATGPLSATSVSFSVKDLQTVRESDLAKRFGELTDYDVKQEATVLFPTDSTDLPASGKKDLDDVMQQAKAFPGYLIEVKGFADASGKAVQTEYLNFERGQAVLDYLLQGSISRLHLLAPGAMGTAPPVASKGTTGGQTDNGRVVVKLLVNRGVSKQ
jgi:outer membrane protein OmpA-like peptidoglycan-associated protein